MSLQVEANYLSTKSILLKLNIPSGGSENNFTILLDVPNVNQVEECSDVDWRNLDFILLSSYSRCSSIVYITEYTGFKGMVLATDPTVAFSRLLSQEFIHASKDQAPIFNLFDIEQAHQKIRKVFFNAPVQLSPILSIQACSSGAALGGSNFIIQYGSIELVFVAEAFKKAHPNYRLMDEVAILRKDLLIVPTKTVTKKPVYNKSLKDLWPVMESYIKSRGTLLFPTHNVQDLFSLIESIYALLDSSSGLQRPIHVLSKTGKQAILHSSIFSEWMSKPKQELSLQARVPLLAAKLMEKRNVLCHETVGQVLSYAEPRIIICTQEFDLIEIFHSLAHACVIASDSSFKVPERAVFYYDKSRKDKEPLLEVTEIVSLINPRNVFTDDDVQYFNHDWKCMLPNDVLEERRDGEYLPFSGTLDLHTNRIIR